MGRAVLQTEIDSDGMIHGASVAVRSIEEIKRGKLAVKRFSAPKVARGKLVTAAIDEIRNLANFASGTGPSEDCDASMAKGRAAGRIAMGVIVEAVLDLSARSGGKHKGADLRDDARRFFCDGRLELFCESCGANPESVRRILVRAALIERSEVSTSVFRYRSFIEELEETGNKSRSAKTAGLTRDAIYKRIAVDPEFEAQVENAVLEFRKSGRPIVAGEVDWRKREK